MWRIARIEQSYTRTTYVRTDTAAIRQPDSYVAGRDAETGRPLHPSVEEEATSRRSERGRPAGDQTGHLEFEVTVARLLSSGCGRDD